MKKMSLFVTIVLIASLIAGCAGTPVVYYSDCTCPTGSHDAVVPEQTVPAETQPAETAPAVEGAVKTGLAILASAGDSKDASIDANGENVNGVAEYDVTVVAVTVDDKGVIHSCIIDSIKTSVGFDNAGIIASDITAAVATKNELGEAYGMKAYGGAKYEWNEQAAALAAYAVGKTVEELRSGAVGETGYAQDADLATTATIYLGGYVSAIEKAVANAVHLGAQAGDELKLAIIPGLSDSKSADGENAGTAQLNVDAAVLTVNGDTITSCQIDAVQAKVNFDATGVITGGTEGFFATKNELGPDYGMVAWAGAVAEWNEQAASFAAYVTGKTAGEVMGIAVDESTHPTDADLASSVTIAIGGFQALIAKACG